VQVNIHPNESHLVTGGYDQTVRLYDIQTGAVTKVKNSIVYQYGSHLTCAADFSRTHGCSV
jgi:WD40 repeat protein